MDSGQKPWAVPALAKVIPRKRNSLLFGIISLCLVLLISFLVIAKTVTVEADGKKVNYFTVRKTVGDFLNHTKLNVYPEDLVLPGRDAPIQRGMDIVVKRSVPVTIKLDGKALSFRTLSPVVGQALDAAGRKFGFKLKNSDEIEPDRSTPIQANMAITVNISVPMTIVADGTSRQLELAPRPVKDVLAKEQVTLGPKDLVTPQPDEMVTANTTIKVVRVTEKVTTIQSNLPYQVVAKPGDFPVGLSDRIINRGSLGLAQQTVKITYEDGVEVDRAILSQQTLRKPVDEIVARGSQTTVTRGGQVINFKRAYLVRATGYSGGGSTSLGISVQRGVVAVDPRVIPYYSKLWVEGYGWGRALDTGGAIKGNRIDLYFDDEADAWAWGSRNVIVYVQ